MIKLAKTKKVGNIQIFTLNGIPKIGDFETENRDVMPKKQQIQLPKAGMKFMKIEHERHIMITNGRG